jgi:Fur family ferric uptake transcriptional regulator
LGGLFCFCVRVHFIERQDSRRLVIMQSKTIAPRKTKQKDAIRLAFTQADRPLAPEEALRLAQAEIEGLSLATVYRNINSLVEEGWLLPVEMPGEAQRYEVAGKAHHHHFRCNTCGRVFELEGCGVTVKPKLPRGFRADGHEYFIFGSCADCR